jgi:hypothetical protein
MSHDAADVNNREAAPDWGGAVRRSHKEQRHSVGANAMRSMLVFGLLMIFCASADAATAHHYRTRHVIMRPGVASSFAAVPGNQGTAVPPGWYKFPGYPPIPPEANRNLDPSTFGGG